MSQANPIVYQPSKEVMAATRTRDYMRWLADNGYPRFDDYDGLYRWSVDALEEEISATAVVMIFVSKGYFLSKSKRAHTRYSDITTYIVYGMLPEAV